MSIRGIKSRQSLSIIAFPGRAWGNEEFYHATPTGGTTLVEVLIAIFIMGIGMIALLTLFPLGAIRMAQAIQDNSCANAVVNANAVATLWDIRNDPQVSTPPGFAVDVFKDTPAGEVRKPADPNGPSYPVFIDPVGFQYALPGFTQKWLCGNTTSKGLIARGFRLASRSMRMARSVRRPSPNGSGSWMILNLKPMKPRAEFPTISTRSSRTRPRKRSSAGTSVIPGLFWCKGPGPPILPSRAVRWSFSKIGP